MTPWTRIEGTKIWLDARADYESDYRRFFHGWSHIERRYAAAARLGFEYDEDLDLAILTHDVVWDHLPDKEARSAQWLRDHIRDYSTDYDCDDSCALIMTTSDHLISSDNRMLIVDFADLMDDRTIIMDYTLLEAEAKMMSGIDGVAFAKGCSTFFDGIIQDWSNTSVQNIPQEHAVMLSQIMRGMRVVSDHARGVVGVFSGNSSSPSI